jgi:hypothetical protein
MPKAEKSQNHTISKYEGVELINWLYTNACEHSKWVAYCKVSNGGRHIFWMCSVAKKESIWNEVKGQKEVVYKSLCK